MKRYHRLFSRSALPILIMILFTGLLFSFLLIRIYLSDRDQAYLRITVRQACLAAESGVHYALQGILRNFVQSEKPISSSNLPSPEAIEDRLPMGKWRRVGSASDAFFRLLQIKRVPGVDRKETPFVDESALFQLFVEGRSGKNLYRSSAVFEIAEPLKRFAVFNSLNEYYYGTPLQPWIAEAGGVPAFYQANQGTFDSGAISLRGVCNSPELLVKMFSPEGSDPFLTASGEKSSRGNYGRIFGRGGKSPCQGPLGCSTPLIVDDHTFFGPILTSFYLYRRGSYKPTVQMDQTAIALASSRRIQQASNNIEGDMPSGILVDRDSPGKPTFAMSWLPDFDALEKMARKDGIYIDEQGRGFLRGEPNGVDYHFGTHERYSETYLSPTSTKLEQDHSKEGFIVLSTPTRYGEINNLDAKALGGARIIFSENTVFLRGDIGGDLVIVTPRHILLTGSTNVDLPFNLFLVPREGVGISTTDLEEYISNNNPDLGFITAAKTWIVKALIYKPGAGWYGTWSRPQEAGGPVIPMGFLGSRILSITILGGCIEGNINRWVSHAATDGIVVKWDPSCTDRLPVKPVHINLMKTSTVRTQ